MKRVILSKDKEDLILPSWLTSIGIEVLPPTTKMDSWIDGLIIGGGATDKERDKIELELIDNAIKNRIPVLGICRGAEMITTWARGILVPFTGNALANHKGAWHKVLFSDLLNLDKLDVWSNHHLRIENPGTLKPIAFAEDGSIEAIADPKRRILGVLWHPERSGEVGLISVLPWLKWIEKRF